jgi:hypothetical protein
MWPKRVGKKCLNFKERAALRLINFPQRNGTSSGFSANSRNIGYIGP